MFHYFYLAQNLLKTRFLSRSATSNRQVDNKKTLKTADLAGLRQVSEFCLLTTCQRPGLRPGLRQHRSNGIWAI